MGQAYGADFARLYDAQFAGFAVDAAPFLHQFLHQFLTRFPTRFLTQFPTQALEADRPPARILDLCCGTGQLARTFLDLGHPVTGVDLSEEMLSHARRNAGPHLDTGRATFVQADASSFELADSYALVVSTFDALNHLPDLAALRGCLASVARVTLPDCHFVFDLNTRRGLLERWNGTAVVADDREGDEPGLFVVNRASYDGGRRAEMLVTGFRPDPDRGGYHRFDEAVYNTVFGLDEVHRLAGETGWSEIYFARLEDLDTPLAEPELEARVFAVATRGSAPQA
jgi:SAM-dependent methyltransferase